MADLSEGPALNRRQRFRLVAQLERLLDGPATYLAFVFAGALVIELVLAAQGEPIPQVLAWLQFAIWSFFALHFVLGVLIAPHRLAYLRRHWLTAASLALPFLRVVRLVRFVAVLRATRLLRIIGAFNRTAETLRRALGWSAIGYAAGLSVSACLLGAAGLVLFESEAADPTLDSFADALWWTAATMTTIGAQAEPVTVGGRVIGLAVMLSGLILLGYIAGLLGTVLLSRRERSQPRRPVDRPSTRR